MADGPKVGKADLLRLELAVAEAGEKHAALKAKRPRCESCGRLEVVTGQSKLEDQIRAAGVALREARQRFREARNVKPPEVPDGEE